MFKSRFVNLLGIAFVGIAFLAAANAQEFPTRPIKLIIGFGAGGLGDVSARLVMQKMSASLGKPIIVENMPGPGGMAAAAAAVAGGARRPHHAVGQRTERDQPVAVQIAAL